MVLSLPVVPFAIAIVVSAFLVDILFLVAKAVRYILSTAALKSIKTLAHMLAILVFMITRLLGADFKGSTTGSSRYGYRTKVFLGYSNVSVFMCLVS